MMTFKKPSKTTFFLTPLQSLQYFGFTSPKVYITLDSVEPEILRDCRGVHEKVHDSPPSTGLINYNLHKNDKWKSVINSRNHDDVKM